MPFDITSAIADLIEREGGYSNSPNDAGGETNHGITEAIARAYGYTGEMADLSVEFATDIYLQRYWQAPLFNQLAVISPLLAAKLFDIGVNSGQSIGARYLQRALNALDVSVITADGRCGPVTFHALRLFLTLRGAEGEAVLLAMVRAQQAVDYVADTERNPAEKIFEWGWQRRMML